MSFRIVEAKIFFSSANESETFIKAAPATAAPLYLFTFSGGTLEGFVEKTPSSYRLSLHNRFNP
jgi:hypothetical protein